MASNLTTEEDKPVKPYHCSFFYNYREGPSRPSGGIDPDYEISHRFVTKLDEELSKEGLGENYYYDKVLPGKSFFDMLSDMIKLPKNIVFILTNGFITNHWHKFCQQTAFKSLIDSGNMQRLVCIAIGMNKKDIPGNLDLILQNIVYFNEDWEKDITEWEETVRRLTQKQTVSSHKQEVSRLTQKRTVSSHKQEDTKSPEIFISYQWDKQETVMVLYERLTKLGYHCWMDIHQMDGGDSLNEEIYRGIRGCQVFLACVTKSYSRSKSCKREVSLADNLKRPIIPLLLEKIAWPPEGSMSVAFTELLYIDCHSDKDVQDKWIGSKFERLIQQIDKKRQPLSKPTTEDSVTQLSKQLETIV